MSELTCQIKWVDASGRETPDTHPAIGLAVLHLLQPYETSRPIPICAHHAERIWSERLDRNWQLLPLPGQRLEEYHPLVVRSLREFVPIPRAVVEAVRQWVKPEDFLQVLNQLQVHKRVEYDRFPDGDRASFNHGIAPRYTLDHCSVFRHGMYVGIEPDGYLHT